MIPTRVELSVRLSACERPKVAFTGAAKAGQSHDIGPRTGGREGTPLWEPGGEAEGGARPTHDRHP